MALDLSIPTRRALRELAIEPNIIIKFEGLDVLFSAQAVQEFITINCPGFFIGAEGFFIGGLKDIQPDKNRDIIDDETTSFQIRQQINHDEGKSSSISTMNVGLVDENQYVTMLISPDIILEEIMGRKAQVFVTFGNVSFFEDSIEIFKGFVTAVDSGAGLIKFKINHPDNKKNVQLFQTPDQELAASINSTSTTLALNDATNFILPSGPLTTYLRVGSEIMRYTGKTGNTITGLTRGVLGSTAQPHSAGDTVSSLYTLEGNPLDLAMQIMMSGHGSDPVHSGIEVTSFLQVGAGTTQIANAVYFDQINIVRDFGLRPGDTVTISGATNGANNVTLATVDDVVRADAGYYVVLSGVSLVLEQNTSAVMDTFTQFNTLESGMKMTPDEVDIDEHEFIRDFFLSAESMRIFIKEDEIEGKEFIDEQLYKPIACYGLPRKAKASVGYTVGPIPGEDIVTINDTNVKNPQNVRIVRTQARSFFNEVVYKYEDSPLSEDVTYTRGDLFISQDSKNRIPGANRTYVVESLGLRVDLNAQAIASANANRILDRYKFVAETVYCDMLLRDSVQIEIGDKVVGELEALQVSDITRGDRIFKARLFEVLNKSLNLKTGQVSVALLDTGLGDARFGLMSPCSLIKSQLSPNQILIKENPLYPTQFGEEEFRNWENVLNNSNPMSVLIRNEDFSVQEDLVVTSISENVFLLDTPPTITIVEDMYIEFTGYVDTDTSDRQKLIYAYMSDDPTFPDGEPQYLML